MWDTPAGTEFEEVPMNTLIAPCGLDCMLCDARSATVNNDAVALAAVARKWTKEYGGTFTAESVRCHGCHATDGVQVDHCRDCNVRLCAIGKGYVTCAECADFGCEKLAWFFKNVPGTRERLEALRAH
jgi:hypothetical protein